MPQSDGAFTRSILAKTLTTISNLAETLDDLLAEESLTLTKLESQKRQVKDTENRHKSLKDLIEATSASKGRVEVIAHDLRCQLSPMKSLPTELLIKVFVETIAEADEQRRHMVSRWGWFVPNTTCLCLTQVCTRWRHIFSLNPSLWNRIEFRPMENNTGIDRFLHYNQWGLPDQQSLFIPDWSTDIQISLLATLGSVSTPYQCIEVDSTEDPAGLWDVHALNAQDVVLYRSYRTPTTRYFTPLLQSASKVTMYGNPPHWGTALWTLLQTLIIRDFCNSPEDSSLAFSREDFIQLLNATPSLTRLELDFKVDETLQWWDDDVTMFHTGIKSLSIHLHHFTPEKGLFGVRLDLPGLYDLEFSSIHCSFDPTNEGRLVSAGICPTTLILPDLKRSELALAAHVLHCLPSVETLYLSGTHSNSLLIPLHPGHNHLEPTADSVPIPTLKTLHLKDCDINGQTLLGFVQARLRLNARPAVVVCAIECIRMYNVPGVSVSDWEKVRGLLGEGRVANKAVFPAD